MRWKEGEIMIVVNTIDRGYLPTDDPMTDMSGQRYEADFTIVKGNTAEDAVYAFTRMTEEPEFDQMVIDNIEVNGKPAIETVKEYETKVSTTIFPTLPSSGWFNKGETYSYNNGAVMVVQSHERTIYTPEETPALFSFYRDNAAALEWMAGEKVELGWTRTHQGKEYEVLQAHQTQVGWEPTNASALWKEVQGEEIPVWVQPTGAHDAYNIGDKVHFPTITDPVYESVINANVWSPTVYAAGWKLV
jgi:hypothetical protein